MVLACLAAAVLAHPGLASADPEPGRFALLVGANLGDRAEPVLRHAEQDAARLAQTLRLLGEFPADQVVLMTGATATEVRDALIRLNARVREHANGVLVVFYSGHADSQALHLSGTRMPLAELKALLVGSPAVSRLLIVDACRSGSLIQLKGAHQVAPFAVPAFAEPVPEGFAVLTSSSASEDSQESLTLGSSYFTYYVNSGLIGAADQDHNNVVSLAELYSYASAETRAATVRTVAGPQTPTFQFALGGQHDLVLTRLGRRDARLGVLRFAQMGRYSVQRHETAGLSPPVAEVAARDAGAELSLPPGRYRVTQRSDRDVAERDFVVVGGEVTPVELAMLVRIDVGRAVRKGGPRPSATGVAVAAGWHGAELGSSTLALGSGPNLLAAVRHDRRRFSLEGRLGLERGVVADARGAEADNKVLTPAVLGLFPVDWKTLTFAGGVEVGLVALHQRVALDPQQSRISAAPAVQALVPPRWSTGVQGGPVAQLDAPLGPNTTLRLESALLWRVFSGGNGALHRGAHLRVLMGIGVTF